MPKINFIPMIAISLFLQSCGGSSTKVDPPHYSYERLDSALIKASSDITKSLVLLAQIESVDSNNSDDSTGYTPARLDSKLSIVWNGPPEQVLQKIADISGYNFSILGNPSAIVPAISINAKETPIIDILRDVSYQARKFIDVMVHEDLQLIELRYVFK